MRSHIEVEMRGARGERSDKEMLILELLSDSSDRYGLEMVGASGGSLKRGTIYVTLGRMEEKGYVTSTLSDREGAQPPGPPRRVYRATASGLRILAAWQTARASLLRTALG